MSRRNENWLLVEWAPGDREVVHVSSVLTPSIKDLDIGVMMNLIKRGEREPQSALLVARATHRDFWGPNTKEEAGPSSKLEDEPGDGDYSPSASSWAPSEEEDSGDSDLDSRQKIKLENTARQYINRRSKKIMTPSHRANPVIPKTMQDTLTTNNACRKKAYKEDNQNTSFNKSQPDSTKKNNTSEARRRLVTIDVRELESITNSFHELFRIIDQYKRATGVNSTPMQVYHSADDIPHENEIVIQAGQNEGTEEIEETEEYENEEFNRSDDNVLITNKYDNQYNDTSASKHVKYDDTQQKTKQVEGETTEDGLWVPIGSGKTKIHVDQFDKVNWKSYTVATRTLLLAAFPRRVLATHCLTGKKSPAFLNKPAKTCLNPKIISDVIIEIMDRFDVKENLVRGIITTKCADECKMWKQRARRARQARSSRRSNNNQENEPPAKRKVNRTEQQRQ